MKFILIAVLSAITTAHAAGSRPAIDIPRLADAIYKAEGGEKTRYPYGIKSIRTADPRRVCINTINNRLKLWDGKTPFIPFLADRYCPKSVDPIGHGRWIKNVTFHYNH